MEASVDDEGEAEELLFWIVFDHFGQGVLGATDGNVRVEDQDVLIPRVRIPARFLAHLILN